MGCYKHLSAEEREDIMCWKREGISQSEISARLGRSASTVSREISRNSIGGRYRASAAQAQYEKRRESCVRRRKLEEPGTFSLVADKFLNQQWSPEQIEIRLKLERPDASVSKSTIYRAIAGGLFDTLLPGNRKARRRLRHKGRKRANKGTDQERRGKFNIPARIDERPKEAEERTEIGHWESDTVVGVHRGACVVTSVDRKSGFAIGGKALKKGKDEVAEVMKRNFSEHPAKTCTPDCGKEFSRHQDVSRECGVLFFFAYPRHPWERGSNENFNGLLREYFPKGTSFDEIDEREIQEVFDKLNLRPRKRHNGLTPYEVYYSKRLHLV